LFNHHRHKLRVIRHPSRFAAIGDLRFSDL
jgi:hypothetical protein